MPTERKVDQMTDCKPTHDWLRQINITFVPGPMTPLLEKFSQELLTNFEEHGHNVQYKPENNTDVILTTAKYGESLGWRKALLFTARYQYKIEKSPTIFTIIQITKEQFDNILNQFSLAIEKDPVDPNDFVFDGLNPNAYKTLAEQGKRGGSILSLARLMQSQSKSIRVILLVGDDYPLEAYTFDLVGAYPKSDASDLKSFYDDLSNRIITALSTHEITEHEVLDDLIPREKWQKSNIPEAMRYAGLELGKRDFFTDMVRIADLVDVPAINDAVSSQYSEGCYATWDPSLNGLVATITGSARPVDKDNLTDDELAVIVGIRADGKGAQVQHVNGKRNDPPSSEAVELMDMDTALPKIKLDSEWGIPEEVPITRSKLHGHRGVKSYNPEYVEHVFLSEPYYYYPVSCSTEAQARAIKTAFSNSEALMNPSDPRQVVFTILPGHGIVIVEKWVKEKVPFQVMWEYMDQGYIQIDNLVPQGMLTFVPDSSGLLVVKI
jgi:hypothetical protein